jgi:hypothetical protein
MLGLTLPFVARLVPFFLFILCFGGLFVAAPRFLEYASPTVAWATRWLWLMCAGVSVAAVASQVLERHGGRAGLVFWDISMLLVALLALASVAINISSYRKFSAHEHTPPPLSGARH